MDGERLLELCNEYVGGWLMPQGFSPPELEAISRGESIYIVRYRRGALAFSVEYRGEGNKIRVRSSELDADGAVEVDIGDITAMMRDPGDHVGIRRSFIRQAFLLRYCLPHLHAYLAEPRSAY